MVVMHTHEFQRDHLQLGGHLRDDLEGDRVQLVPVLVEHGHRHHLRRGGMVDVAQPLHGVVHLALVVGDARHDELGGFLVDDLKLQKFWSFSSLRSIWQYWL